MRIQCKNCHSVYNIAREKIPQNKKKVKCTNCGNVWLFYPREHRSEIPKIISRARVPFGTASKGSGRSFELKKVALGILMLPLVFFFSSTFQHSIPYSFRRIYRLAEIYDTSGIKLLESSVRLIGIDEYNMVVRMSWTIMNNAEGERFVPGVCFVFYDKEGKSVFFKKLSVDKYKLIPGDSKMKFEKTISEVPRGVETVKVKAGNAFEVLFY